MRISMGEFKRVLEAVADTDDALFIPDESILKKILLEINKSECSSIKLKLTVLPYIVETLKKTVAAPEKFADDIGSFLRSTASLSTRQIVNSSVEQRRMDGLARLLSLPFDMTPCVAVALHQSNLFIATNSLDASSIDAVKPLLELKMAIIQDCIRQIYKTSRSTAALPVSGLSTAGGLVVTNAVRMIMAQGGCGEVLYAVGMKKPSRPILEKALSKLIVHCLNNAETREQILNNRVIILTDPRIDGRSFHAEQQILSYIRGAAGREGVPVPLGISKLSCETCADVLSQSPDVTFRGISGNKYPNVYSIFGGHSGTKASSKRHSDAVSESESEIDTFHFDEDLEPPESPGATAGADVTAGAGVASSVTAPKVTLKATATVFVPKSSISTF